MSKGSILVIEDIPIHIRVLNQILSPLYDLKAATSGQKGIELAHKHPVDLILLDILMEDMSGFDVLSALKSSDKTKEIPVIFVTSMDSSDDEVKGLEAGAVDYITKPFIDEIVRLRVGLHMQLIEQMRTIKNLGLHDGLTGIRNRLSFNMTMQEEWDFAIENKTSISMVMIDVDYFKKFNDKYGHLAGDMCLKIVADTLKSSRRESDSVFRWGGEEFMVLLPETLIEHAKGFAERLRKVIEETPIKINDNETTYVTVSMGVGTIEPKSEDRLEDFCDRVDKALYKAKENGRNCVSLVE